ncbi:MAG TPA: hypothetical protein V6D11_08350 [Waterburya sp.]|jgi:hypothetical protein
MFWSWIADSFASLSGCDDDLFKNLWIRKRLSFDDQGVDAIDEYSARLVCATLSRREHLLLVLPDLQSRRPALLFATALIRYWYDSQCQQPPYSHDLSNQRVLYFGSTVGIRTQLQQVTVGEIGLNLADVFRQQHTGRQTRSRKSQVKTEYLNSTLPEVLTIYAPVDPIAAIEQYKPQWIAVDCGNAENLSWLRPLLQGAIQHNITVIAWGQNPLSECVANFSEQGQVFIWPIQASLNKPSSNQLPENLLSAPQTRRTIDSRVVCHIPNPTRILESALKTDRTTRIQPLVIEGTALDTLDTFFREAYLLLCRSTQNSSGRLARDTLRLHWKYLRSLESLSIPFDFHEAEAPQFWGMKSFGQLSNECEHFRNACYQNYPELVSDIEQVSTLMEAALEQIKTSGSPLWRALCNLAIEELPTGEARLITFTSRARKQLFLLALLARYNWTEEDLRAVRTWVFSLDELRQLVCQDNISQEIDETPNPLTIDKTLRWHPLVVGLPSPLLTPKLLPILLQETADILLYRHQTYALARQADKWTQRLGSDISRVVAVLSSLSGLPTPQELPYIPLSIDLAELSGLDAGNGKKTRDIGVKPLWKSEDPVSEVARLLKSDEEVAEDELASANQFQEAAEIAIAGEQESWCESAVEVYFDSGWYACFAADDSINVIVTGSTDQQLDKRYVRSLKAGDRVLAIPGQRRQSLYDLIISRIHGHPTIELHLALIRRWQEDFVAAYQRWQQHGVLNLEELRKRMQERGSTLSSTFTLRQWLWGNTLCPDDPEDLYRLAEVLDMDFVRSYYRRIYQAAKRLRGLHRGLSRRLNNWLEQQATGSVGRGDEDLIDSELGLTFNDFRSSLLILRVTKVQSITGLFLRDSLGKFEKE